MFECKTEIATIILEFGNIHTRPTDLRHLINKAYLRRILLGQNRKYDASIGIAVQGLSNEDLDQRGESILKSCCEIGSLSGIQSSLSSIGIHSCLIIDVNLSSGMALFTCITSGNHDCLKWILSLPETDRSLFTITSLVFAIGIVLVELCNFIHYSLQVALLVFLFLLISWIGTLTILFSGSGDIIKNNVSQILELSAIALPCIIGIFIMYNLVPIHRVVYCLYLLCKSRLPSRA